MVKLLHCIVLKPIFTLFRLYLSLLKLYAILARGKWTKLNQTKFKGHFSQKTRGKKDIHIITFQHANKNQGKFTVTSPQ